MNSSFRDDPLSVEDVAVGRDSELLPRVMGWRVVRTETAVIACVAALGQGSGCILLLPGPRAP